MTYDRIMVNNVNSPSDNIRAVDIQTVPPQEADPSKWLVTSLPIEPYLVSDLPTRPREYLDGPITPHLLRIQPGDAESVTDFVNRFGFLELYNWAASVFSASDPDAVQLWARVGDFWDDEREDGSSWLERNLRALARAWEHPDTIRAFTAARSQLEQAWSSAADPSKPYGMATTLVAVLSTQFPLGFTLSSHLGSLALKPSNVVGRSWTELVQLLKTQRLRAARCEHCGQLFPPRRSGQRFCPGTSCRTDAYRSYERSDYRREYQKMYKRYRRDKITLDEWDRWRDENPSPGLQREDAHE
jgi:hypothetical protein